ncbi:cyclic-nucleotide-gated cation channel-like protein [Dermatophagoides farinae]|uniref:Cyclic-nucleotide-gated cation channel-like protein n=1 Tax=Dermatophagoides farinae TaxID=6954 RepID=A0A9D4P8Y5_DERFA|nr:cyclic nucleotide-gated cation channel beta-3-like [Dermatophagoides farinae]KAH7646048.1 cyclic-nucleotide-gated cation channel-like protein [Dermatophagoides farinae]
MEIENSIENNGDDDEVESLFKKKFVTNLDDNNATLAPVEQEKSFDLDDSNYSELDISINRFHPNNGDILVVSTPNLEHRKIDKQKSSEYSESNKSDDESDNIQIPNTCSSYDDGEVEDAKRYLKIYSKPSFRWSMDMIPNNIINFRNESQVNESSKKFKPPLSRQCDLSPSRRRVNSGSTQRSFGSTEDEHFSTSIKSPSMRTNDDENYPYNVVDEEDTISIFQNIKKTPIPVIVSSGGGGDTIPRNDKMKDSAQHATWITERMRHLVKAFTDRGDFVRRVFEEMNAKDELSKSDDDTESPDEQIDGKKLSVALFESMFGDEWRNNDDVQIERKFWQRLKHSVYEPQSFIYIIWLLIVSLIFFYNATMIPYSLVFRYNSDEQWKSIIINIIADMIYLVDCCWFKPRLKFLENGNWIDEIGRTHKHYFRSRRFILIDFPSQLPFDWIALLVAWNFCGNIHATSLILRLNRLIKIMDFWEFFERVDKATRNPYLFRIIHTLIYELYIIHLGACVYYRVSEWIGFGHTPWTYNNKGIPYLRCFYFAFRTTTSIGGRLPKPTTEFERIYMLIAWLLGVFVFAMVIGQIRDIVAHASRNQNYYIDSLNKIAAHMTRLSVPANLQKRVRFWYKFTWDLQKTFNETEIIRVLPLKMRTDLTLCIHSHTLSRVDLFKNINRSILRDLVLKLQPILFLPGDYICRKGDVGHEMYIVNKGTIQVFDPETRRVLVTLGEGSVFGEIAILNLHGQTKRTADVRSCGYSQLFALKKQDLWETLRYYPEYENVLKRKVQRILRKKQQQTSTKTLNIDNQPQTIQEMVDIQVAEQIPVEPIVKERPKTPKLFQTVLETIKPESTLNQYFIGQRNKYRSHSLQTHSPEPGWMENDVYRQKSLDL